MRFHKGSSVEWQDVEDLSNSDDESDEEGGMSSNSPKVKNSSQRELVIYLLLSLSESACV